MKCILRHITLSLVFVAITCNGLASDTLKLSNLDSIVAMDVDANGYMFVADEANTLYKFDNKGKVLANVNIKVYGAINKIDCSNPFEIYSYHKDQNIVVFYDNMLNVRGSTPLNDFYFNNVATIERSYDNGIWLFNLSDYKLQKIDKNGKILASSFNLVNVLGENPSVFAIKEFNNKVYVADSTRGLLEFDLFATYGTTYFLDSLNSFEFSKNVLFGTQNKKVIMYSLLERNTTPILAKISSSGIVGIYRRNFYSFKNNFIVVSSVD